MSKSKVIDLTSGYAVNPGVVGSSPTEGYDHDSSYGTSTGCFQEAYSSDLYKKNPVKTRSLESNQTKIKILQKRF